MAIQVGEEIPDVELAVMRDSTPATVRSRAVLSSGNVVLFAVPGAFTPTCSDYHLPGFVLRAEDLQARGVDKVACVAVNDVFVMDAWARAHNVGDSVLMLADGNGDFTRALGLELDATGFGMGIRSQRYAMLLEDGRVAKLFVEAGAGLEVSSAEAVLASL